MGGQKDYFNGLVVKYLPYEMLNRTETLLYTASGKELLHRHGVTQEHSHQLGGDFSTPAPAHTPVSAYATVPTSFHAPFIPPAPSPPLSFFSSLACHTPIHLIVRECDLDMLVTVNIHARSLKTAPAAGGVTSGQHWGSPLGCPATR